ncbi:MAG: glycosyltransferase family 4 protein [candidate division Zixibacteria bacterium]|nr:glycosyltransferase family 4 protein [candidate division Zixibacteria bacterium]
MRIRFVTLYFPPEVGAAQRRISELARRLSRRGHEVTVLTGFPNYPSGIKPEQYRGKITMRETIDGVTVVRVPHYIAPNRGFARRICIHLTFAFSASVWTLFHKRPDIVYLESPPLFNGFIGLVSRWVRRTPYFFNVADLWPQTAIELGALKNKWLIAASQKLERLFYHQADKVLAVTDGIRRFILAMGYPDDKVALITNGVDHTIFSDAVEPDPAIIALKQDGAILAVYAGTHGMAHALGIILQAAARLRNQKIVFLFIGDGPEKEMLIRKAADEHLNNVFFRDARPQSEMPGIMRAADVALIPLRDLPLFDSAMPSKCFEALAAGVPVMLSVRGEMAEHVRKAECGLVAEPENLDQITAALRNFVAIGEAERKEMGRRGREYVVRHFSREGITVRLEALMQETIARGK